MSYGRAGEGALLFPKSSYSETILLPECSLEYSLQSVQAQQKAAKALWGAVTSGREGSNLRQRPRSRHKNQRSNHGTVVESGLSPDLKADLCNQAAAPIGDVGADTVAIARKGVGV